MKLLGKMPWGSEALAFPPAKQTAAASEALAQWTSRINSVWARGTATALELARVVHAARRRLARGEWSRLWQSGRIRFSKRKGDMLATIGRKVNGLSEQTFAHLPAGWSILYQLVLLDPATLESEIQAGTIHPGMTLRQARELLAKFRGKPVRQEPRKRGFEQQLEKIMAYAQAAMPECSPQQCRLAVVAFQKLRELALARLNSRFPQSSDARLRPPSPTLPNSRFQSHQHENHPA